MVSFITSNTILLLQMLKLEEENDQLRQELDAREQERQVRVWLQLGVCAFWSTVNSLFSNQLLACLCVTVAS